MPEAQREEALLLALAHAGHERGEDAGPRAPGDMEARHRVAVLGGRVAATLGPADDREPAQTAGMQPGALLARGKRDVGLRPFARHEVLLAVEARRAQPVLQGKIVAVADAHAPLLGRADEEQPAERPEGLPTQRLLRLLVEQDDAAAGLDQLGRGDKSRKPASDHDGICVHTRPRRQLTLATCVGPRRGEPAPALSAPLIRRAMRSVRGAATPVLSASASMAPCRWSISVGRRSRRSSHIDERACGSMASMRRATSRNKMSGNRRIVGIARGGTPSMCAGCTPAAFSTVRPSSICAASSRRQRRSASSLASGKSDRALSALLRLRRSLPHSTPVMSACSTNSAAGTSSASRKPATPAASGRVPGLARWERGRLPSSRDCTTLKGTIPATACCSGCRCARRAATLPTPFCRLTTVAPAGACWAISRAMSLVAPLL